MKKKRTFLHTEAYRRTFFSFLFIALLFSAVILGFMYRDVYKTARENFLAESFRASEKVDNRAGELVKAVDQFSARIYSDTAIADDFFRFFGVSAEEYVSRRLNLPTVSDASILKEFSALVERSNYSIRHILFYARENIVDLEFNARGDARHRIISAEEAGRICRGGSIYQKDIHKDSEYLGKVTVVADVEKLLDRELLTKEDWGLCILLPEKIIPAGNMKLSIPDMRKVLESGSFPRHYQDETLSLYCASYSSQYLPFSILYMAETNALFFNLHRNFILLFVAFILAFGAISLILIRRFSGDSRYLSVILSSMEEAEKENFRPLPIPGKIPEYDAIIRGLNDLYAHLESLIHQEYQLTISQQKAEMEMLSTQLSPHFLYNTLERIRMRAVLDHALDVAEATAGLGTLYRNIVKTDPVIPIKRETEITEQYLDLMSFLYGDEFMYYLDVDPKLNEMLTPKIWMQPILENFFKHNFRQDDQIKVIFVELNATEGGFRGKFFNNIGSMEPDQLKKINEQLQGDVSSSGGIGLMNVLHRLRLFYGPGLTITMENNDPAGIAIHIIYQKEGLNDVSTPDCG